MKFTVDDDELDRLVKFGSAKKKPEGKTDEGMLLKVRVAKRGQVNDDLFKQFHHEKGHIGQRQGRETIRRH